MTMRLAKTVTAYALLLLLIGTVNAAEVRVPAARDLQADAEQAEAKRLPILVLFSSSYCDYCTIVREDFLEPMLKNATYKDKVIIRMVSIDDGDGLRDFNGNKVDADTFSDQHNVFVTPTVKLFAPDGSETVPALVGLYTVDYYGGYLDNAIDESLAQLRGGKRKIVQK
jgi:thioredoxin-related protein